MLEKKEISPLSLQSRTALYSVPSIPTHFSKPDSMTPFSGKPFEAILVHIAASVFCTPKRPISGIALGCFILSCFVLSLTALIKSFLKPTISCSHLWTLLLIQSYACLREAVQCRRKSKTWEPTRLRFKSWLLLLALDFTFSRSAKIFAWEYICKIQDNDTYIAIYSLWHIAGLNKLLEFFDWQVIQ